MLFNSFEFLFGFLPAAIAGFFLLARVNRALAAAWLAAVSLWFYAQWDARFVPLLLASIAVNFASGRFLARRASGSNRSRRALLIAAVTGNLVLLGVFKYLDFFISTTPRCTLASRERQRPFWSSS